VINTMDDCGSKKRQVRDQHVPIVKPAGANEQDVTRQRQYGPPSEPAGQPVYVVPADVNKDTGTINDSSSIKHQVHNQHIPDIKSAETNRQEVTQQRQYEPRSEPANKPISEVSADMGEDIGNRRLITSNHTTVDSSRLESVRLQKNVHEDMSTAYGNDMEKSPDDQVHKTRRRLVSPRKHRNSFKTAKADNAAANPNHEASHNPQSDRHQPTKSGLPSGLSGNLTKPEQGMIGAQPGTVYLQNANLRPQNLLLTPRWLSDRQSELRKVSKVEIEPVTNVTIGRIEVRATPLKEVEQPKGKRKASGVMSLDKYLRMRSQGGNQ
jgi:hypothetical protein